MLSDRTHALWNRPLSPADPTDRAIPQLSIDEAMKLALTRRPEIGVLDATVAQNAIDQQLFADQARPRVDLVGGYSLAGLAGTAITQPSALFQDRSRRRHPAERAVGARVARRHRAERVARRARHCPPFLIGGWADSLANIANRRYPTGTVQLQMELPLGNRTAKANLARSRIEQTQLARQRLQLEQAIEAEVRNALQAVESSNQRLRSAATARRNAQEQYDSERRRFDSGLSTVFLLLDRQTRWSPHRRWSCVRAPISIRRSPSSIDRLAPRCNSTTFVSSRPSSAARAFGSGPDAEVGPTVNAVNWSGVDSVSSPCCTAPVALSRRVRTFPRSARRPDPILHAWKPIPAPRCQADRQRVIREDAIDRARERGVNRVRRQPVR